MHTIGVSLANGRDVSLLRSSYQDCLDWLSDAGYTAEEIEACGDALHSYIELASTLPPQSPLNHLATGADGEYLNTDEPRQLDPAFGRSGLAADLVSVLARL